MSDIRDLSPDFLNAMREKLQSGREKGKVGWDRNWLNTSFPTNNPSTYLLTCLKQEILELNSAMHFGSREDIRREAADIANFAMMIADITGSLTESDKVDPKLEAELKIGDWLSAALDDPDVCEEMKADIMNWFTYVNFDGVIKE